MDTASMLTVAPRGMVILVILLETPSSSSTHCLLIGMVAELEQVPKAFRAARHDGLEEFDRACLTKNFYGSSIDEQCKSVESYIQNDQLGSQRQDRLGSVGFYNRYDGTEDTDRGKIHHGADDLQTYLVTRNNQM